VTAAGDPPVLQTADLGKRYGDVWALRHVDVEVLPGETLGIVGESGSGKSTLARLLLALDRPTEGEVRHLGRQISGRKEKQLRDFRRAVQIVFQDPMSSLDPRMTVHDILAEPLRSLGLVHRRDQEAARVNELLAAIGLPGEAARRYPHEFSGGQRQRIALARAVGPAPRVLVADEPVSALDVSVRAQILNLLSTMVEDLSLTLVFISHDMAVVRHLCRRVLVMYRGLVVEDAPGAQLFANPRDPYTRELIAAAPRIPTARSGSGSS
jgi:ABC-type glutathione transport system ATPase component